MKVNRMTKTKIFTISNSIIIIISFYLFYFILFIYYYLLITIIAVTLDTLTPNFCAIMILMQCKLIPADCSVPPINKAH